ncbi:sodium/potassium/calcium exchanger 2-like isoform X1 [Dinothrombium tinctorium]|uniref:Sodium/potassium/calcium exchanger 2-like isoform X1 n=1 Tax=Dinothrombium tinctorium TaxID=1965070 RepID=A0A443RR58_9ACAR|nr:sodium/potassium/calcium exchanger 2-like isoform X1 [Dinothrombium tinctorium]
MSVVVATCLFRNSTNSSTFADNDVSFNIRRLLSKKEVNKTESGGSNFPPDLFSLEQKRHGAVILHIAGMVYMFVALAIVCDEFFVPSLEVITERLGISEDVAGATFMAAGGSAPELFTSIIGVFISKDDVGVGTIVGSAVFNILFVISMCAIFSKSVLKLTWWPLFRDVTFYSLILISLMFCFNDSIIHWWEATILLLWYAAYVIFMKYNATIELYIKKFLNRAKVGEGATEEAADNFPESPSKFKHRRQSIPILHGGSSKFRQGVLQLMIHSIDPLHEEMVHHGSRPHSAAANGIKNRMHHVHPPGATTCAHCLEESHRNLESWSSDPSALATNGNVPRPNTPQPLNASSLLQEANNNPVSATSVDEIDETEECEEKEAPLDVSWPSAPIKQVTYVLLAPIIIPLWLTLPDVRRPEKRRFYYMSFLGSILWIAIFSYLMVWWANLVGETFGIPSEVMGLTFLAAGTSIPDLITSVLVARKGLGDMAVSSSVGSNIFDVTVGLPFPWLLYTIISEPVEVNSSGMACSIFILFMMLLFVIAVIAIFKWQLNVGMAVVMFLLYFLFLAVALILEYNIVSCSSIFPSS